MRGWITTALVVTFLSGASSGFVAGRASAPDDPPPTWIDIQIQAMRNYGVDGEQDLKAAEEIYKHFEARVKALKGEVNKLFGDRLKALEMDAEGRIQRILDRYSGPVGEKEK